MICVSIAKLNFRECQRILINLTLAELRLELLKFNKQQIKTLFALPLKLVATCRPGEMSEGTRKNLLTLAIESGASYVDIEIEADHQFKREIIDDAKKNNCRVIISYHNFERTPEGKELKKIVCKCFEQGADIAKIACLSHGPVDNARLLSLYERPNLHQQEIIAIGMGDQGRITRVAAPFIGAPFTFAAINREMETASGQLDIKTMKEIISKIKQ